MINIGQLLVATLMLGSLVLSALQLKAINAQLEAAKAPSLVVSSFQNDNVNLLNSGGATIKDIVIFGTISVIYRHPGPEILHRTISAIPAYHPPEAAILRTGDETHIPFSRLTTFKSGSSVNESEREAYAFILRYHRAADNRPFFCFISFARFPTENGLFVHMPLGIIPGSVISGRNIDTGLVRLREELKTTLIEMLDIRANDLC